MVSCLYKVPKPAPVSIAVHPGSSVYPEPDTFKPERFLNPDGSLREDPILLSTFGYGRCICPRRHFVDATLFITVASLFSVFSIPKEQGSEAEALYLQLYGLDREVWLCPSELTWISQRAMVSARISSSALLSRDGTRERIWTTTGSIRCLSLCLISFQLSRSVCIRHDFHSTLIGCVIRNLNKLTGDQR